MMDYEDDQVLIAACRSANVALTSVFNGRKDQESVAARSAVISRLSACGWPIKRIAHSLGLSRWQVSRSL